MSGRIQSLPGSARRRTLCTEDARDIIPQLPFFTPKEQSPSRSHVTRRPATSPMSINVQLADSGPRIRPLPRIPPSPKSAPPVPRADVSRAPTLRPLPSLPESDACTISVTPATPLPPPSPSSLGSSTHLTPPGRAGLSRFSSLSLKLQISPDALNSTPSSPLSPTIPEPPSPTTAQRKRMRKLRRHLGESVQFAQVYNTPRRDKFIAMEGWEEDGMTAGQVPHLDDTNSDSASSDGDGDGDDDDDSADYVWEMLTPAIASDPSTPVKKWVREIGKRRLTEDNFHKVLNDLRAL